jgi:SAM-dependent methyltransferase
MTLRHFMKSQAIRFPIAFDALNLLRLMKNRPKNKIECVCCGKSSRFRFFGMPPRLGALCPHCEAVERHRLLTLFLDRNPDKFRGKDILHFAPEKIIRRKLEPAARKYVGCDIAPYEGVIAINIEKIELEDNSFDLVVCNHVLEHVDDGKALQEIHRVLRKGGTALLMFPIIEGWSSTYENSAVNSKQDRILHFGQEDHVRFFGADVRERIKDAGFRLEEFTAVEPDVLKFGLLRGEKIFIATKAK